MKQKNPLRCNFGGDFSLHGRPEAKLGFCFRAKRKPKSPSIECLRGFFVLFKIDVIKKK